LLHLFPARKRTRIPGGEHRSAPVGCENPPGLSRRATSLVAALTPPCVRRALREIRPSRLILSGRHPENPQRRSRRSPALVFFGGLGRDRCRDAGSRTAIHHEGHEEHEERWPSRAGKGSNRASGTACPSPQPDPLPSFVLFVLFVTFVVPCRCRSAPGSRPRSRHNRSRVVLRRPAPRSDRAHDPDSPSDPEASAVVKSDTCPDPGRRTFEHPPENKGFTSRHHACS